MSEEENNKNNSRGLGNGNNTRFDIEHDPNSPQERLEGGYNGSSPTGMTLPPCSIEDVDTSLFKLFNEHIGFTNREATDKEGNIFVMPKPYVIFATGERFALVKRSRPPRDNNKQLLLPSISIRRKSLTQNYDDINSRGINQFTGELVIKRRLAQEDRDYQNLLNKLAIGDLNPSSLSSTREQGEYGPTKDLAVSQGSLLGSRLGNNVWEIITIPQPQFFTATYEINFWTTHTEHMNYLITMLMAAQLPQGKTFRLNTPQGYWFIATIAEEMSAIDNIDDFTEQKRILKYSFQVSVRSFVLAPQGPGMPVPIRRTLSATELSFEMVVPPKNVLDIQDSNKLSDKSPRVDELFGLEDPSSSKNQQEDTLDGKVLVNKKMLDLQTGKVVQKYVKVLQSNQKSAETVYYARGFENIDEFIRSIKK